MNEEKKKRYYKVEVGDIIEVKRTEYGSNVFYKTPLYKKMYDGTTKYFEKPIAFQGKPDIPNESKVKVLNFFEDVRDNKNDRYNPIWSLVITEYELIENDETMVVDDENIELEIDDLPF